MALWPMGNVDNGIEIGGNAHDIIIGGPQATFNVIPQNTISANGGNGVAITGTAHDNVVNNSYIGTDVFGLQAMANAEAGVFIDSGSYDNTIGSTDPALRDRHQRQHGQRHRTARHAQTTR